MPDQSFHVTACRLRRPRLSPTLRRSRLVAYLTYGCAISLIMAIAQRWRWRNANPKPMRRIRRLASTARQRECRVYDRTMSPNRFVQSETSPTLSRWPHYRNSRPHPRRCPARGRAKPAERSAQNPAGPEIIRPGVPTRSGDTAVRRRASGSSAAFRICETSPRNASPFDPTQFRLPTLGLPPGLGTPEPTPEIQREYGQFVEREIAPENTIQIVVGRAKVIVLAREAAPHLHSRRKRGWFSDRHRPAICRRRKESRHGPSCNLWFPDPRDPNDPNKDRTLSYMVVVLPDPERAR